MEQSCRTFRNLGALCLVGLLAACQSWVELSDAGRNVSIVTPATAEDCERLGRVTATSREQVAGLRRDPERLQRELQALARNEAAGLGANAILATTEVTDGRQTFDALRCD